MIFIRNDQKKVKLTFGCSSMYFYNGIYFIQMRAVMMLVVNLVVTLTKFAPLEPACAKPGSILMVLVYV